jgi:hypothetical protein
MYMVQNQLSCAKTHKDKAVSLKEHKPRSRFLFGEYMNKKYIYQASLSDVLPVLKEKLPFLRLVSTQFDNIPSGLRNSRNQNVVTHIKGRYCHNLFLFHSYILLLHHK